MNGETKKLGVWLWRPSGPTSLRAFLTTLGVVIGSACIVLVVTVAVTGRRVVLGQIEAVGANLVYAHYEVNPQEAVVIGNRLHSPT